MEHWCMCVCYTATHQRHVLVFTSLSCPSQTAIAHMLERVCNMVPSAYRDQCEAFIEQYSKKLIELLLEESPPHTICTLIHLCKGMETPITGEGTHKHPPAFSRRIHATIDQ